MKFSDLTRGAAALEPVELPGYTKPDGSTAAFHVRVLTGAQETEVLAGALAFAKKHGADTPRPGDPLYDQGIALHTVALGYLDPESGEPAFASASEVEAGLSRDLIAYLFERQEVWQAQHSPYLRQMSSQELAAKAVEVAASSDDAPFTAMSPATRWLFARSLASLVCASLVDKSPPTSPS